MGPRAQGLTSGQPPERRVAASPRLLRRTGRLVKRRLPPHLARGDSAVTDPPRQTKLADGALVFRFRQTILAVILGLVPRIQPSTDAGASGWMDGRDEPDHDNPGTKRKSHKTSGAILMVSLPALGLVPRVEPQDCACGPSFDELRTKSRARVRARRSGQAKRGSDGA